MKTTPILLLLFFFYYNSGICQTMLVPYGSSWKYLDKGTNQRIAWRAFSFNDGTWASGNAQLGYGDGDETTIVSFGLNASKKYITTYFRKIVSIPDTSIYNEFNLEIKRDDGAIVYINGVERFRTNMPTGIISYLTIAASDAADDGNEAQKIKLPPGSLINGNNIIAVEIHQRSKTNPDISFDLQLSGMVKPDLIPPVIKVISPLNQSENVPVTDNLIISFNEKIVKGTGNIQILEGGVVTQTIDVQSSDVQITDSIAVINPANYGFGAQVSIQIQAGVFKDLSNNNYVGNIGLGNWNFKTEPPKIVPETFISLGAEWRYFDKGIDLGTTWTGPAFNDTEWAIGRGQLGYGDNDEETIVGFGPNSSARFITTYFRKTITIQNPSEFSAFAASVKRDDGVVIYVNGIEVFRNNMPSTAITYRTLASGAASDDGNTAQNFSISSGFFVSGQNVIAVEIHQNVASSNDLSFDFQLVGTVPGAVISVLSRGPYMNSALQNGIVLKWRTDTPTNSQVNYGTSALNLTQSFLDNALTTEHEVALTGLTPNTLYYYSIGSSDQVLQGDSNNYFKTLPLVGSTQKIRIMAMGDMGNSSANQVNVRKAWQAFNGNKYTDAWLLLGDNAYNLGLETEYQTKFFNIYQGSITKNHVLWPAPGNHDYGDNIDRQADHLIPYYNIFTLPTNGEAGGIPSNNEAYYSYNYANVHFVSLDSYGWEDGNTRLYDTLGPQAVWLKQDLAANTQPWTVVYFHHPPYTKGSHNSDNEPELINMRGKIVPILERYKVDLVLSGHSHSYERSYLINGHYGLENTFSFTDNALSTTSGKYDGSPNSCVYIKNASETRNGIVYAVVGSSGQLGSSSPGYPHDAMYNSNISIGGLLYFEVESNRLDAKWIGADGIIQDNFTIMKNVNQTKTIKTNAGSSTILTASWLGNYRWSTGATTQSITVSPTINTSYNVSDEFGCITDNFNVEMNSPTLSATPVKQENLIKVFPTLVNKGQVLHIQAGIKKSIELMIVDISGRIIKEFICAGFEAIETSNLSNGTYFIIDKSGKNYPARKFIIIN